MPFLGAGIPFRAGAELGMYSAYDGEMLGNGHLGGRREFFPTCIIFLILDDLEFSIAEDIQFLSRIIMISNEENLYESNLWMSITQSHEIHCLQALLRFHNEGVTISA